ncbi:hypothetical protein DID88_003826 [Monilinia fructigena]|uniref:PWI domain-containing protein n=1 Tax=Monilinia fructigena TaxID=38457 RepID=A0A395IT04_9HELO|nr:hypothetical protein DID88_003826 [Monilinia fructigena]
MTSVDAKLLKSTKFPPEFNQKVDFQKVNLEVMKKWIAGRISDILGAEDDDVVIELCFNLIEGSRYPDIKKLQIQLTGFLDKDTPGFCKELWKLCLSAQTNPQGVPKELLEAKKLELIQEKIQAEQAADEARRRREDGERRDREMHAIRNRERGERGGRGRGDSWRGGRGDRDFDRSGGRGFDRRGPRYSRSPRGGRDNRDYGPPPRREFDTYVPAPRGRRDERRRPSLSRSRSPSRSDSLSRSPPRRRSRSATGSRSPSPRRRRSRSPDRRNRGRGGRGRARSPERRPRRRSLLLPNLAPRQESEEELQRIFNRSASPPRRRRSSFKEESRDGNNDNGRRRRSKQRYEPADRRGRKSSADVEDGREKRVDTEEKKDRGSPTRVVEVTKSAGSAEPAEDSPVPSGASTPVAAMAPTPLSTSFQKGNGESASNHPTPTSATSGKGKKNKKMAGGDDSETESRETTGNKKARTNFGAARK